MDLKQTKGPAKQWCSIKHHGVMITTQITTPMNMEVVNTSQRACKARANLHWRSVKQQEIQQLRPLLGLDGSTPWTGKVLKTSQKAGTVGNYLD